MMLMMLMMFKVIIMELQWKDVIYVSLSQTFRISGTSTHNRPIFLYPLKTSCFLTFSGGEEWNIGLKWVKILISQRTITCSKLSIKTLEQAVKYVQNYRTSCEICSKLIIKTPERRPWRRSGVFIVSFEHISHLILVLLVIFDHINAGWKRSQCRGSSFIPSFEQSMDI